MENYVTMENLKMVNIMEMGSYIFQMGTNTGVVLKMDIFTEMEYFLLHLDLVIKENLFAV